MRDKFHQKLISKGWIFALFVCFLTQAYSSYAGPTQSYGCQGVEPLTAEELSQYQQRELYGLCPSDNAAITGILKLRQNSADAVKRLIKRDLFDALKEEALGDQLINRFRIWDHQGYGLKKEWKARPHYGSVFGADHPAAIKRLNDFIRERNKRYADLTEDEVKTQKERENLEYKKELISASRQLAALEHEIKIKDDQLYYLDRDRSPLHPRSSWTQKQMDAVQFEKELLLSQIYFIKDTYPILQVQLPERYRPEKTISLASHLNDPDAFSGTYIRKAKEEAVRHVNISIHGDGKEIPGLLNLNYSEENLRKLLLLDGLREKTLDRLDDEIVRKVACEIVSSMIPESSGWTKPALYLGGMGLACGLGWLVSGPVACLSYVAVAGAGVGIYETAHAIPQAMRTHEDYEFIHTFFTSSIEGPALASSEQEQKTYQDLKNEMWWAWTSGLLTAADLPFIAHLLSSNIGFARQTLKALRAMREGGAPLREAIGESFKMARTLTEAGKNPHIYENLIKLMSEGDIQKIREFNKFMAGFSELSSADQRLVLEYLHEQPSIDIHELKQHLSAEAKTAKTVKSQLVIDEGAKHVDPDSQTAEMTKTPLLNEEHAHFHRTGNTASDRSREIVYDSNAETIKSDRLLDAQTERYDGIAATVKSDKIMLQDAQGNLKLFSGRTVRKDPIGQGTNWKVFTHPSDHRKVYKELRLDHARTTFEDTEKMRQLLIDEGYEDILTKVYDKLKNSKGKVIGYVEDRAITLKKYIEDYQDLPDTSRIKNAIQLLRSKYGKDIESNLYNIGVNLETNKAVLLDVDELGEFWQATMRDYTGKNLKLGGALKESSPLRHGDMIRFIAEDGAEITLGKVAAIDDFPLNGQRVLIKTLEGSRLNITKEFAEALTRQPHVIILPNQNR